MEYNAKLEVSAIRDGVTFIVMIEDRARGRKQVIEGVLANSEEEAIDRVMALIEQNARARFEDVRVLKYDSPDSD